MTSKTAKDAIAILIDLAQQGEIDPWNVDVIKVIDRFLSELSLMESSPEILLEGLSASGQAFLWASMLILFKADTLERLEQEEQLESICLEDEENIEHQKRIPLNLESHLRRRALAPTAKKRKVTLQELIEQIEHIALELEKDSPPIEPKTRANRRSDTIKAITQLAHNENLTELAQRLYAFFQCNAFELMQQQDSIELEQLLTCWYQENNNLAKNERVGVFWALLLLSAQSKVELSQQEFYQDLTIRPLIIDINKNTWHPS